MGRIIINNVSDHSDEKAVGLVRRVMAEGRISTDNILTQSSLSKDIISPAG